MPASLTSAWFYFAGYALHLLLWAFHLKLECD